MSHESSRPGLMEIFSRFAFENDIPSNQLSENQIVLAVRSDYNTLSSVFLLQANDDGYEHLTHQFTVPIEKRGEVAKFMINESFREISPVLPDNDNRLFTYGSKRGLLKLDAEQIREGILDDMGRIAGFNNEKHAGFSRLISD